nr:L-histidine N(alpha)-methyltransferase [Inmirania thermothiophila]
MEHAYKYDPDAVLALAGEAGLAPVALWTDPQRRFSLHLLAARGRRAPDQRSRT